MERHQGSFLSFVLGILLGGILGLLFAPRPGKETREILKKTAKDYSEKGKILYEEKSERLSEAIESGKKTFEEKSKELKERFGDIKEKVSEKISDIKSKKQEESIEDLPSETT